MNSNIVVTNCPDPSSLLSITMQRTTIQSKYTGYGKATAERLPPLRFNDHPSLRAVRDRIAADIQYCNHLVLNLYLNSQDNISPHNDKTQTLTEGSMIVTISLGAVRTLVLENMKNGQQVSIDLQPGSVFVLGWKTNQEWKHSIPKAIGEEVGKRISLTYRSIFQMMF